MSSRHEIPARDAGIVVVVGWDNPTMTFFAQVERIQTDNDPRDPVLLWAGDTYGQVARPKELTAPLAPFAALTQEHVDQLCADRAADVDRGPTALQRAMLKR